MESDTDTFTYFDIDPSTELHTELSIGFYSHFDTDLVMYSRVGVNADPKKEIRIESQLVTGFYSMIRAILLRFWGAGHWKNRLNRSSATDFADGGGCGDCMNGGHTLCRQGLCDLLLPLHCHKRQQQRPAGVAIGKQVTFVSGAGNGVAEREILRLAPTEISGFGESLTPLPATSIHSRKVWCRVGNDALYLPQEQQMGALGGVIRCNGM